MQQLQRLQIVLLQLMSYPGKDHWQGVKRISRYIKGTLNYGSKYSNNGNNMLSAGLARKILVGGR